MKINLMCDLETTGTEPGCCILSIALVPFAYDPSLPAESMAPFYETISHRSSRDYGFTDCPDTLSWWNKQKKEIQEEAFSGTRDLQAVLESVAFYIKCLGEPKEINLWGNGKDFDNIILAHTFKRLAMKQPWHYANNWCYRDFTKLYPQFPKQDIMQAHNALADAQAQAAHLEVIMKGIKDGASPILP